jgi:hypothetical protein
VRKKIGGGLGWFWEVFFKLFFEEKKIGGGLGWFWEVFFKLFFEEKKNGGGLGWFWEVFFFKNFEKFFFWVVVWVGFGRYCLNYFLRKNKNW